ncbi:hypothetical protein E1B28_005912 [Marasmius oreades]|uniref:Bacteriophage T5 Orf172 DNA-binding domain-containing protein n=1 Tax=Marasmius oreades TaxID=181124 RepID=A0A9P7S486_9AGAR|nr:uncharacterized protein E1B28_005912 [Marasmius oreades]KAG7095129.1 hypothetical protein E1B28_005912 [Marasmius oreades]
MHNDLQDALQAKYDARKAQPASGSDKKGWIYVLEGEKFVKCGRTNKPERRIKEHRRRCKLDETQLREVYKVEIPWANRTESLLHIKLKMAGFHISKLECACTFGSGVVDLSADIQAMEGGVGHVERYICSRETVDEAVGKIKELIDEVRHE